MCITGRSRVTAGVRGGGYEGGRSRNERVHVRTCAWVHAASISGASRRRRRQSVAAPPSAPAITPPALTLFWLSLSLSLLISPCMSLFASTSLRFSASPRLRYRFYPSLLLHPAHPKFAKIFEAPFPLFPLSFLSLYLSFLRPPHLLKRKNRREFFCQHDTVLSELLFLFFSRFATTRAGHVLYCWCRVVSRRIGLSRHCFAWTFVWLRGFYEETWKQKKRKSLGWNVK